HSKKAVGTGESRIGCDGALKTFARLIVVVLLNIDGGTSDRGEPAHTRSGHRWAVRLADRRRWIRAGPQSWIRSCEKFHPEAKRYRRGRRRSDPPISARRTRP